MPDINNNPLFVGDSVKVGSLSDPSKRKYEAAEGNIVSTTPFGGGRLFEVRFNTSTLPNALFEGCELVRLSDPRKPWREAGADD